MSDELLEKMLDDQPVIIFSFYTANQIQIVRALGNEIIEVLDVSISEDEDGQTKLHKFTEVYGSFWLWVLGTFEIVRTMVSAKPCFSVGTYNALRDFKARLVRLRIPFAKQQIAGSKELIKGEASVVGFDGKNKDVAFKVGDEMFWIRQIVLGI